MPKNHPGAIWERFRAKKFDISRFLAVFGSQIGHFVGTLGQKWPVVGGPRGVPRGPGGPKTIKDPQKNTFLDREKKLKNFFVGVQNFFSAGSQGPAGGPRGPKWAKTAHSGVENVFKRSGVLKNIYFDYKYDIKSLCVAQDMPETRFWADFGRKWARPGPGPWGLRKPIKIYF